jgi:hypothetical protein
MVLYVYNMYYIVQLGEMVGLPAYYARGRGFDFRTVHIFVCLNISVCVGSGCSYGQYVCVYKKKYISMYLSVI